jgi:hypothetical protein
MRDLSVTTIRRHDSLALLHRRAIDSSIGDDRFDDAIARA